MSDYLWIIDLPYMSRLHHGGLLRYFNLSRELLSQGHSVTFAVRLDEDKKAESIEWMESLLADGVFSHFCEFAPDPSVARWNRAATLLLPFGLHRMMIRPFIASVNNAISAAVKRYGSELVIVSSQSYMYVADQFTGQPCIGEFCDSLTLRRWREFLGALSARRLRKALVALYETLFFMFQEIYSSRNYAATIVASPVDMRVFDWLGNQDKNVCITNGVRIPQAVGAAKNPKQIVFSGAMNFPPNFEGALWFLDRVFPLVLQQLPDVTIVIAGGMPDPKLLERAGPNVIIPGFVPDLNQTLAESALYVAPLISGSGFKNKIVESIANGTYVIGTTFAVEFLDPAVRELIVVRDDPGEMAQAICDYLRCPASRESQLGQLREILVNSFSWPAKARELALFCDSVLKKANGIQRNKVA